VYLLLYEEGLKQDVGIFYQVQTALYMDAHYSAHWTRHVHHVSTLVPKQYLQLRVSLGINIVRKRLKASVHVVTLYKLSFDW